MGDESVVKSLEGKTVIREVELSNGKKYKMVDVRYKQIKKALKLAGDNKQLLNDLLIQEFFPEMTQEFIDDLRPKDIKIIADAISEETGITGGKIEGF